MKKKSEKILITDLKIDLLPCILEKMIASLELVTMLNRTLNQLSNLEKKKIIIIIDRGATRGVNSGAGTAPPQKKHVYILTNP